MENSKLWKFLSPDVNIASENCLLKQCLSSDRTFALSLFVHIFHKCHSLYSVVEQDAIFCRLKVLQLKNILPFNMALSGAFWILL